MLLYPNSEIDENVIGIVVSTIVMNLLLGTTGIFRLAKVLDSRIAENKKCERKNNMYRLQQSKPI